MIKINHSNIICYSMKVINDPEKDQDVCNKKYLDNEIKKKIYWPIRSQYALPSNNKSCRSSAWDRCNK